MESLALVEKLFELEDHQFQVVTIDGVPWWFVTDVEEYLGYASGSLRSIIRGDWKEEFDDGVDFRVLEGQDLESLRQIASDLKSVSNMTRHVMLLSETGIYTVTLLSRKPKGRKMRRWLASDVLPSIRETGNYSVISSRQSVDEILAVSVRHQELMKIAKMGHAHGIVGDEYLEHIFEHAIAAVSGTESHGERQIDVSTFLDGKGFGRSLQRRYAGNFGKLLKKEYMAKYGVEPKGNWKHLNGADRFVRFYLEHDLPLFEKVYAKSFKTIKGHK